MVVGFAQVVSSLGLACMVPLNIIKPVSFMLAVAVVYCTYNALMFVHAGNIKKHCYWSIKLCWAMSKPLQHNNFGWYC